MKRNILILFAVLSLIISLTGCGSSGHSNSVAPTPTTMTTLRVSLTQNGQPATGADAALYTPAAAMREGLIQAQNNATSRASIGLNTTEGVYKPTSTSADGTYTFTVPAGEYTLIANKGAARAVVTEIRAAAGNISEDQEVTPISVVTVGDLKATGKITGKVVADANYGITTAGVMVYLKDTSCVAITNSDGSFEISGVPEGNYFISATTCQNGCYYSASLTSVPMGSELFKALDSDLTLIEVKNSEASVTVTGTIIDGNNAKVANVLVLATNEENLLVSTTGQTGTFTLNLKKDDSYTVYVHGSKESSQVVQIEADGTVKTLDGTVLSDLKFTMYSGTTASYGCVNGIIQISNSFISSLSADQETKDFDRYLVRLVGSSTTQTYYNTQTRADFKIADTPSGTEVNYSFDSIPEGTYSVFVDPAGNGFLGSVGDVVVKSGQTTVAGLVTVNFVKPVFEASPNTSNVTITKKYPFTSSNLTGFYKKLDRDTILIEGYLSDETYLFDPNQQNFLTSNGQYEIVLQNSWSDEKTGFSGTLTEKTVIEYSDDSNSGNYLGNTKINNLSISTIPCLPIDVNFSYLTYYDGFVSGLDDDGASFNCKEINNDQSSITEKSVETGFAISKSSILYTEEPYTELFYNEDITDSNSTQKTITYNDGDSSASLESATIISKKYLGVIYSLQNGDYFNYYLKVFGYNDTTFTFNTTQVLNNIVVTNSSDNFGNSINQAVLAESPSGNCYIAVSKWLNNYTEELVEIYAIGASTPCATYNFSETTGLLDFKVLRDGSFYIELGDSSGIKSAVRLTSNGNKEESKILSRKSCVMDKQGFLYRFDKLTYSVIKTETLDGKPLETYKPTTTPTGGTAPKLDGILGIEETQNSSTLFVW